jgi:hypothetical protein
MDDIKRLQVCLEDPYHFPDWWILSDRQSLFIELSKRKGNTSIFDGENTYAGENNSYKFYIIEYGVTEIADEAINGNLILSLVIKCVLKKDAKSGGKIQDRIKLDYQIYPPFYVE